MRTRVKICCIGPIGDDAIAAIAAEVPPPVATFLLTAETSAAAIAAHVRATRPSVVQVVSHIDPAEAAELAMLAPEVRRVQVVHVEGREALAMIPLYAPYVHAFLLDSGRPHAAVAELGGTGRAHDWSISAAFVRASERPVFLAGGLTADNVGEAIRRVRPFGLDLCSGVRRDGRLDAAKVAAFMAAVRHADAAQGGISAG
jgi:phosphoribosylanthranilate isomerase